MSDTLPRAKFDKLQPGTWVLVLHDALGDAPRYTAVVGCPECSRPLSLVNHAIAADGQVTPSIGHPESFRRADGSMCSWHPTPRLEGWPNLPAPAPHPMHLCARCGAQSRDLGGWGVCGGWPGTGTICAKCFGEVLSLARGAA